MRFRELPHVRLLLVCSCGCLTFLTSATLVARSRAVRVEAAFTHTASWNTDDPEFAAHEKRRDPLRTELNAYRDIVSIKENHSPNHLALAVAVEAWTGEKYFQRMRIGERFLHLEISLLEPDADDTRQAIKTWRSEEVTLPVGIYHEVVPVELEVPGNRSYRLQVELVASDTVKKNGKDVPRTYSIKGRSITIP